MSSRISAPPRLNPLTNGSRIRTGVRAEKTLRRSRLNPLTNGSRIRTKPTGAMCVWYGVSIPLRTGLGFEPSFPHKDVRTFSSLNPLTNGSRIRTESGDYVGPPSDGLNPLTNGSRIRTKPPPAPARGSGGLNPLTNGSRIRTSTRLHQRGRNDRLNPLTNGSRIRTWRLTTRSRTSRVSIPLRTGLGFELSDLCHPQR